MAQNGSLLQDVPVSVVTTLAEGSISQGTTSEFRTTSTKRPDAAIVDDQNDRPLTRAEASAAIARSVFEHRRRYHRI